MNNAFQNNEQQPIGMKLTGQYQLDFPISITQVCNVFSNRVLLLRFGGKPRELAIVCNICGPMDPHYSIESINIIVFCSSMQLQKIVLR